MKTLAEYLAEYIDHEHESSDGLDPIDSYPDGSIYFDKDCLKRVIENGFDAYESVENCSIGIVGGDCPDCSTMMQKGKSVLYAGHDEIEVVSYECPECGYIVYG